MRTINARSFFVDALTTSMASDELLIEVRMTCAPPRTRAAFREYARRHGDFAIAACAVQLTRSDGVVTLNAAVGGVGTVPYVCRGLAAASVADVSVPERIAALVDEEIERLEPQSDLQASAEYRRTLARIALMDCLRDVLS